MSDELKKVLYVEDDEDIAELTQVVLEEVGGFEVTYCDNGKAALEAFASFKPQIALIDVMMPEMDGPTTMKEIRNLPGGDKLPVIFLTAKAQTHQQQQYIDLGASAVIMKPFGSADLCETMKKIWKDYHDGK